MAAKKPKIYEAVVREISSVNHSISGIFQPLAMQVCKSDLKLLTVMQTNCLPLERAWVYNLNMKKSLFRNWWGLLAYLRKIYPEPLLQACLFPHRDKYNFSRISRTEKWSKDHSYCELLENVAGFFSLYFYSLTQLTVVQINGLFERK